MFETLLQSSYFALFLIIALGFMLGRIQIKGLSLDVSAVIFIALLFGHFGVIIPKELGNMVSKRAPDFSTPSVPKARHSLS